MTADADLTIVILRELQSGLAELKADVGELKADVGELKADMKGVKETLEINNERLSMVERSVVLLTAQMTVTRRYVVTEERKTDDEIRDLQARVSRLEDLAKL